MSRASALCKGKLILCILAPFLCQLLYRERKGLGDFCLSLLKFSGSLSRSSKKDSHVHSPNNNSDHATSASCVKVERASPPPSTGEQPSPPHTPHSTTIDEILCIKIWPRHRQSEDKWWEQTPTQGIGLKTCKTVHSHLTEENISKPQKAYPRRECLAILKYKRNVRSVGQ